MALPSHSNSTFMPPLHASALPHFYEILHSQHGALIRDINLSPHTSAMLKGLWTDPQIYQIYL